MSPILLSFLLGFACMTFEANAAVETTPVEDARLSAPLTPPVSGIINVAFLLSEEAELIDISGPWGVFDYVYVQKGEQDQKAFNLYTVAANKKPVKLAKGMSLLPSYEVKQAPQPDIIVVPALNLDKLSPVLLRWLQQHAPKSTLTISVCNGVYVLGVAGLLEGKQATAHHTGYGALRAMSPTARVVRGKRYVEDGNIASSGGLAAGMDLALRVVERYFGRELTLKTADDLEYQSRGWMFPDSNDQYLQLPQPKAGEALDPVCELVVTMNDAPTYDHQGRTYYFNCDWCKGEFIKQPARFLSSP